MEITITNILVGITCLVSFYALNNRAFFDQLKHHPYQESRTGEYYRWLTSGFLHGSLGHLIINMYVLYTFGNFVESLYGQLFGDIWGKNLFLLMYLFTVVVADIPTFLKHRDNPRFASIGASGATSGIVLIFCLVDPWQMFLFPPVPAVVFAILYLGYSTYASMQAKSGGIDHDAHLWGAICGLAFTIAIKPSLLTLFYDRLIADFPF